MQYQKTRDVSQLDYLEALQREYLVWEIRSKIYPSRKDKDYHKGVKDMKRDKIENLAERNNLPTMFDDDEIYRKIRDQIINDFGPPNFIYRDEQVQQKYEPIDHYYYYYPNSDVKVKIGEYEDGDEIVFGKIHQADLDNNIIYVILRGENNARPFKKEHVARIL